MTDLYPIGRTDIGIGDVAKRIESVQRYQKPVWNVVQLHGKGEGGPGYGLREPSYQELRNMTYQSIIAGAKGLLFFSYSGSEFKLYESSQGLRNIKRLTGELHKLLPILLSDSLKTNQIIIGNNPQLKTRIFKYRQKSYLFAVNVSNNPTAIEVSLNDSLSHSVSALFNKRIVQVAANRFSEKIEPLGVRIYQF